MPAQPAFACVVVVHLSPEHESHLVQMLQPYAQAEYGSMPQAAIATGPCSSVIVSMSLPPTRTSIRSIRPADTARREAHQACVHRPLHARPRRDAQVMLYDEDSVGSIADIDGLLVLLTGLRERMRRGLGWDHILPEER